MSEELIKFLGGSTIVIGAIAWLIRSLITHNLNKEVEKFKASIQHQSKLEIERTSHNLKVSSLEYEHSIALLQEKRAEVIAELYRLLIEFVGAAESYTSVIEWSGEPSKDNKLDTFSTKAAEFRKYFVINRIYFSKDVCDSIDKLWVEAIGPIQKYSFWRKREKISQKGAERADDAWDNASTVMVEKVPLLLNKVESEFRSLLGVNENIRDK